MRKNVILLLFILFTIDFSKAQTAPIDQMVAMTNKKPLQQEMTDGVKAVLPIPAEGWTALLPQNMDEIWQTIGLKGVNYYSLGEPKAGNTYSERSNYKSKFYQAWFGTYIIDAKKQLFEFPNEEINSNKKIVIDQLMKIGILDQSSWLIAMGDKNGSYSTTMTDSTSNYSLLNHFSIDGQVAPVIMFSLNTHSDLTDSTTQLSGLVGMPDRSYWQNALDPYHHMVLTGFFIYWYNKTDQTLKIIYGTGCSFVMKDGSHTDTYSSIMNGMLSMARQLKYERF